MNHDLYRMTLHPQAQKTMDELVRIIVPKVGVTHTGNRLTLRFGGGKQVHMLILEVEDGRPEQECPSCGQDAILNEETGLCTRGDCNK